MVRRLTLEGSYRSHPYKHRSGCPQIDLLPYTESVSTRVSVVGIPLPVPRSCNSWTKAVVDAVTRPTSKYEARTSSVWWFSTPWCPTDDESCTAPSENDVGVKSTRETRQRDESFEKQHKDSSQSKGNPTFDASDCSLLTARRRGTRCRTLRSPSGAAQLECPRDLRCGVENSEPHCRSSSRFTICSGPSCARCNGPTEWANV